MKRLTAQPGGPSRTQAQKLKRLNKAVQACKLRSYSCCMKVVKSQVYQACDRTASGSSRRAPVLMRVDRLFHATHGDYSAISRRECLN